MLVPVTHRLPGRQHQTETGHTDVRSRDLLRVVDRWNELWRRLTLGVGFPSYSRKFLGLRPLRAVLGRGTSYPDLPRG
jgi:hypothetical protein